MATFITILNPCHIWEAEKVVDCNPSTVSQHRFHRALLLTQLQLEHVRAFLGIGVKTLQENLELGY